jgi:membrane protein
LAAQRTDHKPSPTAPLPTQRKELRVALLHKRAAYGAARLAKKGAVPVALAFAAYQLARLNSLLPLRAFAQYTRAHGPLMAAGMGFNMFFSITGLLTTGFSIAALALRGNTVLLDAVLANVAKSAPGLLKVGGGSGLVDPQALLNPTGLGWAAVIGAVVTLVTSLGWIQSLRDGLRAVLELPARQQNPLLAKARDLAILLLLGVALLLTSAVTVAAGAALGFVVDLLKLDPVIARPVGFVVGLVLAVLLSALTALIMFRLAAGLRLPRRILIESTLIAGVGTTVLQLLSTLLLAKAGANPVLASFAVIIGLLIWFNFVSQVYLISGGWAAVRTADAEADAASPAATGLGARRPRVTRP